jgi:hypothetical protein
MKIKTTIYIYYAKYLWEEEATYAFYSIKIDDTEYMTCVGSQELEIEVPSDYDPTAQRLAALQKEKEKAQEEFSKKVAGINERISKLQALEYTA